VPTKIPARAVKALPGIDQKLKISATKTNGANAWRRRRLTKPKELQQQQQPHTVAGDG